MNIRDYIGLQYDIRNIDGVNCFGLYALVVLNEVGINAGIYAATSASHAASIFAAQLATGDHGMIKTSTPRDFDFVLMSKGEEYHCGVLFGGAVLHAKGSGRSGSVCYDELYDLKQKWDIEFYETKHS